MIVECPQCDAHVQTSFRTHAIVRGLNDNYHVLCSLCGTDIVVNVPASSIANVFIEVSTLGRVPEEVAAALRLGGFDAAKDLLECMKQASNG